MYIISRSLGPVRVWFGRSAMGDTLQFINIPSWLMRIQASETQHRSRLGVGGDAKAGIKSTACFFPLHTKGLTPHQSVSECQHNRTSNSTFTKVSFVCLYVCTHMSLSVSSSITHYHIFLDRIFHRTWNLMVQLEWLANEAPRIWHLCSSHPHPGPNAYTFKINCTSS